MTATSASTASVLSLIADDMLEVVRPAIKLAKANQAPAGSALAWVSEEKRAVEQPTAGPRGVLVWL